MLGNLGDILALQLSHVGQSSDGVLVQHAVAKFGGSLLKLLGVVELDYSSPEWLGGVCRAPNLGLLSDVDSSVLLDHLCNLDRRDFVWGQVVQEESVWLTKHLFFFCFLFLRL